MINTFNASWLMLMGPMAEIKKGWLLFSDNYDYFLRSPSSQFIFLGIFRRNKVMIKEAIWGSLLTGSLK